MDLASIETTKNLTWDDVIEKILSEMGDEAQINAYLHKKAQEYFTIKNTKNSSAGLRYILKRSYKCTIIIIIVVLR